MPMRSRLGLYLASFSTSVALGLGLAALGPEEASGKPCGEIYLKGGGVWWVGGSGLSCKRMDYWAKSMLLGKGRPKGWQCWKRGKGFKRSGGCSRGWNPQFEQPRHTWIYYPPH